MIEPLGKGLADTTVRSLDHVPDASVESGAGAMPRALLLLFSTACGISVANVYYAQPLLDSLSLDFAISQAAVGRVIGATQAGCALALLFVVPLGDLVNDRRRLTMVLLALLVAALCVVGGAQSSALLMAGMLTLGALGTAMTQGLIAYAAVLAAPAERGRVVGTVQAGVMIGLLLARSLAGFVADLAGWRAVYFTSAVLVLLLLVMLWRMLPARPAPAPALSLSYRRLLGSMLVLLLHERVLHVRGVIAMLMFGVLGIFWSALVLPLSAPPYSLSHTAIGAFGLVGVAGALGAARAGSLADRGMGQWTSGIALVMLALSWIPLALTGRSLWALAVGIILLDLAGQAIHVTNQSMIFSSRPEAHSRLVACYMLFYAVGSGMGAVAATSIYAAEGWAGVCVLGAGVSLTALAFWAVTLHYMSMPDVGEYIDPQ